jgi:hypothetical protein
MTSKADLPLVLIGASPEQFFCPFLSGSTVNLMTGQAPDLALVEGKRVVCRTGRHKIDWMMVFSIVMTAKTRGGDIEPRGKDHNTAHLSFFQPMALYTGLIKVLVCMERRWNC